MRKVTRRDFVRGLARGGALALLAGSILHVAGRSGGQRRCASCSRGRCQGRDCRFRDADASSE
jgi:hypothetical protein